MLTDIEREMQGTSGLREAIPGRQLVQPLDRSGYFEHLGAKLALFPAGLRAVCQPIRLPM